MADNRDQSCFDTVVFFEYGILILQFFCFINNELLQFFLSLFQLPGSETEIKHQYSPGST